MSKREEIRAKKRKERQRNLLTAAFVIGGIAVIVTAVIIYRNQSLINSIVIPEFLLLPSPFAILLFSTEKLLK